MKKFLFISALLLSSLSYADDNNSNPVNTVNNDSTNSATTNDQSQKHTAPRRRLRRALAACAGGASFGIMFGRTFATGVPTAGLLLDGVKLGVDAIEDKNADFEGPLERAYSVWGPAIICAALSNSLFKEEKKSKTD